jgi:general stress protein YciG
MQQTQAQPSSNTRNRGFASMNSERQREIARKGGKAAHEKGTAHEFTSEEARAAGRKGGERVSADRSHMSRIGRLGGRSSAGRRQQRPEEGSFPGTDGESNGNGHAIGAETGSMAHPGDELDSEESVA